MTDTAKPEQTFTRADDFSISYSNSILFESTAWDLRLTFGHIDQATGTVTVKQDRAVTIPWPQAKLAIFWLRVHVAAAEAEVGTKIPIRKDLIPQELPPPMPEQANDPSTVRFRELYEKIRSEFIDSL